GQPTRKRKSPATIGAATVGLRLPFGIAAGADAFTCTLPRLAAPSQRRPNADPPLSVFTLERRTVPSRLATTSPPERKLAARKPPRVTAPLKAPAVSMPPAGW